jgi:4-amino-4-deoxy-L-arabinose transferase-like glycosyltransferase
MLLKKFINNSIIILIGIVLFFPFLGNTHLFDWDEINFAECAREMIETGNYSAVTINYQPFWEKPPLFLWMQVISMKLFGINEFAARFPNAICGIITLLFVFNIGNKLYDEKMGWLWVLFYAGSFLPHLYFRSGIIDPWFNLFIFASIYYFYLYSSNYVSFNKSNKSHINLILSGIFIGLAVMTKGPVAIVILGITVVIYWLANYRKNLINIKGIFYFILAVSITGSLWFIIEIANGRFYIVQDFFEYQMRLFKTQDAGHGGPFIYHFIVLLLGCFPASVPAIASFTMRSADTPHQKYFKRWMMILFWVVLILFSIVKTKIVHYSSLSYFPLTFLAAYTIHKQIKYPLNYSWKKWMSILMLLLGFIISTAIIILPFVLKNKAYLLEQNIIKDAFAAANLQANITWTGYESVAGWILLVGFILSVLFIVKKRQMEGFILSTLAIVAALHIIAFTYLGKIEAYSQATAIYYYKALSKKDCYVETLGYKSYAQLFYTSKKPLENKEAYAISYLLNGNNDKPVIFVCKITSLEAIRVEQPQLSYLHCKNGFCFLGRGISK